MCSWTRKIERGNFFFKSKISIASCLISRKFPTVWGTYRVLYLFTFDSFIWNHSVQLHHYFRFHLQTESKLRSNSNLHSLAGGRCSTNEADPRGLYDSTAADKPSSGDSCWGLLGDCSCTLWKSNTKSDGWQIEFEPLNNLKASNIKQFTRTCSSKDTT